MKVRKRPKVVDARVLTEQTYNRIKKWVAKSCPSIKNMTQRKKFGLRIPTLDGPVLVHYDDWVIQGEHGEFYKCDPTTFFRVYESLE